MTSSPPPPRDPSQPPPPPPRVPTTNAAPEAIAKQVAGAAAGSGAGVSAGGGTIFTEPVLVVNQKAKLIEVNAEYAIYSQAGHQVGAVRQVGQGWFRKLLRFFGQIDQFLTHRLEITDAAGNMQLTVTRPAKFFKSKFHITDANGAEVGWVRQSNMIGKIGFSLDVNGETIGGIKAENWRAWNFSITDHTGTEVARITKTWEGLAKTMFTTADNYVVQFQRPLSNPLLSLVVASALTVDTALKQDSRGFS